MQREHSAAVRVYRIGLIDGLIRYLHANNPASIQRCADMREVTTYEGVDCKRPLARIHELSNLGADLGLLMKTRGMLTITDAGGQYAARGEKLWEVSAGQAAILRKHTTTASTNSTMAILLIMVRLIQRQHEVAATTIMDRFTTATGMTHRWTAPVTRQSTTTYTLNYLTEMGLTTQGEAHSYSLTAEGAAIADQLGPLPRPGPRMQSQRAGRPRTSDPGKVPPSITALLNRLGRQSNRETDRPVGAKRRVGQALLRAVLLRLYKGCCAMCEIREKAMLRTSHVSRWSWRKDARLQPANAILLCVAHDALFEHGLIGLTDECHVLVSARLDLARSPGLRPLVEQIRFRQPHRQPPLPVYLAEHRDYHGLSIAVHK